MNLTREQVIAKRIADREAKIAARRRTLASLKEKGIPFESTSKGSASGIAYLNHPKGTITLRLASCRWTQGQLAGEGLQKLWEYYEVSSLR